jgi:hypothetical protein
MIPVKLEECPLPDVLIPYNALALFEPGGPQRLLTALGLQHAPAESPRSAARMP